MPEPAAPARLTLRHGPLRFDALAAGDPAAPLVLALHGFPDHHRSFRHQLAPLAAAGYRVVCPHLRGYEPTSLPADGRFDLAVLADDVLAWLDQLGAARCHLVGHDWGALIGYAVAARDPERLRSLTTLAVPHARRMPAGFRRYPVQLWRSCYILFNALGPVAARLGAGRDFAYIRWLWRTWSPGWHPEGDELERVLATLAQPGVLAATLAYYSALLAPSGHGRAGRRLLRARTAAPTLALSGADDGCMDSRVYDVAMKARDFPGGLEVHRVAGAGHFLHQERPDEVTAALLDWLRRY